jgi:hypothetical protein
VVVRLVPPIRRSRKLVHPDVVVLSSATCDAGEVPLFRFGLCPCVPIRESVPPS